MHPAASPDASLLRIVVPLLVVAAILVLRNRRARRLKIERLWLGPAIYIVLTALAVAKAPPPVTALGVALMAAGVAAGVAIGWQRGRFIEVRIHPETRDLTAPSSVIGMVFILAIFVVRYAARDLMASEAGLVGLPVAAVGDAFLLLAVAMLSTQRLEVWLRASRMLAEAKAAPGPPPPQSLVS
ncbi:MAG: hypothetical protein ACREEW_17225 [Caulobacteraceae bacterium]